jgi:hypothetical protein
MLLMILTWIGIGITSLSYTIALQRWIYRANLLAGLGSLLIVFPLLIALTSAFPAYYFRALPLAGVGMFIHRYRFRVLLQIKLLWFTTLTVLVVQGYYAFCSHFLGFRLWQ